MCVVPARALVAEPVAGRAPRPITPPAGVVAVGLGAPTAVTPVAPGFGAAPCAPLLSLGTYVVVPAALVVLAGAPMARAEADRARAPSANPKASHGAKRRKANITAKRPITAKRHVTRGPTRPVEGVSTPPTGPARAGVRNAPAQPHRRSATAANAS